MPLLPPGDAHVWIACRPPAQEPFAEAALSREERDRARRFQFAEHRLAYEFAHGVLREVLGGYLERPPGDIRFRENSFGKPFLDEADGDRAVEFNLSHAGRVVLIGVCRGRRIGIDVEEIRAVDDLAGICESCFTSRETAFIFRQPGAERMRAFFRCWTRKEAYVKALGMGLSIPLHSFDTLIDHELPCGFVEGGYGSEDGATWQVSDLDAPEGYAAAIALERGAAHLTCFDYQPSLAKEQS